MSEKETYYENEYVQITPAAPGWRVMYSEEDGRFSYQPVACFALVRRFWKECHTGRLLKDEGLEIHPIVGGECLDSPMDCTNFVAVLPPGEE